MRRGVVLCMTLICLFMFAATVSAQEKASAAQAKMLVEKAFTFVKENGKKAAIAEFNNPQGKFFKGELYIFAWNLDGVTLAMPANKQMVGKNVLNTPDADGKLFRKEAINLAKAKGQGWVDYKYRNPKTNKIEQKTTFVKLVDDMVIGCGAYK